MAVATRTGLVAISWVLWLILVGMFVSAEVPQTPPGAIQPPLDRGQSRGLNSPPVIAGNDLGFRVENTRDGLPVGKLVVRINGHWVEAQLETTGVVPAGAK
jgi:hypothetical protein